MRSLTKAGLAALGWCCSAWCQTGPSPAAACASLRGQTTYEFTVATAVEVPASADGPAYCHVTGQILPEIRFDVNLPASWNHRMLMVGNGGFAGTIGSPVRFARMGYATAATDTGHDAAREPLATFAVDRQKLLDYAFRSLHVTAETAKKLIEAYYGARPARSYFTGCSTGGRQALMLSQRFPGDFDGIVSGAPVLDFTGTMLRFTMTAQALAATPIPLAKLSLLAARIYGQCDAKDGLKDGVIDDPRRCGFLPSRDLPKCAIGAGGGDCFTPAEIGTLDKIYGDVMGGGQRLFPGWPVGAEAAGPDSRSGWVPWIVPAEGRSISATFAESFFRYMAFPEKDPKFDLAKFDFNKDPARMAWIHEILDATDTDLARFKGRGGKLLMYYGWADQSLNAQMGVDYYESVTARMGVSTRDFFRLFMVPGMFHCGGGVGTSTFETLTPLIDWVERGIAPRSIPASRMVGGKVNRTRPLCPYPEVAKYKGSGSIDDAANFGCEAP